MCTVCQKHKVTGPGTICEYCLAQFREFDREASNLKFLRSEMIKFGVPLWMDKF